MLITAIILGFAGSLHCVGMCSPLAFAVTRKSGGGVRSRVLYNIGRILMYCMLGTVVSAIGVMLPITVQYVISITLGLALLVIGITGSNFNAPVLAPVLRFTSFLKTQFSKFLQQKNDYSIFAMGVLNGLLPCGLTFLALTSCITLSGPLDGFIFMAAFGAGTLPVMLGLVSIIPFFAKRLNLSVGRLSTVMQIAAGCLLIVRVLLVEPHIPQAAQTSDQIILCR
jgi:sulfite exporter TauE/SafE